MACFYSEVNCGSERSLWRANAVLSDRRVSTKTLGTEDIVRLRPGLTGYGPLPVVPESMPT